MPSLSRALFGVPLFMAAPALAQTIAPIFQSDRDIVVTGTKGGDFGVKSGIPVDRLPQSIQILTADEIARRGATSVADVLRAVPSANIGNSRVSRFQSFSLKLRGFLVDQMRNGVRQRYYEDVDASALSNVERIEVLKGPSAVLYGQSAVGGIVSIVTKRPTGRFEASVAATVGRFDQRVASLDVGGPVTGTLGVRVTGEFERSGTFVDFQDLDRDNLAVNFRWRPGPRVDAHLVAEFIERRTLSNPGLPVVGTVLPNPAGRVRRERFLAEPAFAGLASNAPLIQAWVGVDLGSGWSVTPRFSYSELDTPFTQVRVRGVDPANPRAVRRNGRVGEENDEYAIAQLDLAGEARTGPVGHKLLVGYEHDRERARFVQSNFASVPDIDALAPAYLSRARRPPLVFAFVSRQDLDANALYAQDQVSIGERLGLVLGARHAWIRSIGYFSADPATRGDPDRERVGQWSAQAGATYRFGGGWSAFGGYNSGYDVENSLGAAPTVDGDRLGPETSDQIEAGLRHASGTIRVSLSAFRIRRRDVAGDDPDDPGFSFALGSFRVRGLELEGEWRPLPSLTIGGGYAYLRDRITANPDPAAVGGRLADVPRHAGNLRIGWAVPGTPVDLRAAATYNGSRALAQASPVRVGEVLLVDLGAGAGLGRFRVDLLANNLLDRRYFTVAGVAGDPNAVYPGDPLQLSLRLGYRWGGAR